MAQIAGWQPGTNVTPPPPVTSTPAAPTPTRTPTPTPLPGDFDQDGNRDFADFRLLLNVFNTNSQTYNLVGSSPYLINIFDINRFIQLL